MCRFIYWPIIWKQKKYHPTWMRLKNSTLWCILILLPHIYIDICIATSLILHYHCPQLTERSEAMEACFLNSNSFTKTLELVPSIKARIWDHPTRYARQLKGRKFATPFSISCKLFNFLDPIACDKAVI